jgi:RNA polymerase sigma factor (sigma-70 family)
MEKQPSNPAAALADLAERFHALVWEEGQGNLGGQEGLFRSQLARHLQSIGQVLPLLADETLALAVKKGFFFKPAFEELFVRRYADQMEAWLRNWEPEPHRRNDLTQELLLKFFQNRLKTFDPEKSFSDYLSTSVYHHWVTAYRKSRRQASSLESIPEPVTEAPPPLDEAVGHELGRRVDEAMDRLPPDQREVLQRTMSGQKPSVIADALGLPAHRVYRLLFEARRLMERELGLGPGGRLRPGPHRHRPWN